jgi:hypothetical protein
MVPRLTGDEPFPDYLMSGAWVAQGDTFCGVETGSIISPYDTVMGCTFYDYQHNSRIPHMNVRDYQTIRGLHHTFMEGDAAPPSNRWVDYQYRDDVSGWSYDWNETEMHMTKTIAIAGYTGADVFRPLAGYPKSANRVVLCHHWTTALPGQDTEMFCVLSIEPNLAGQASMSQGSYYYDIPDLIEGGEEINAMWPACAIDSLNRIHVVGVEQEPETGAIQDFGYIRCQEIFAGTSGDSIMCQAPGKTAHRIKKETYYSDQGWEMSTVGRGSAFREGGGGTISPLACASKVSNRVALVWMNLAASEPDSDVSQLSNDVMYIESMTGGDDWFSGTWPVTATNVTQYDSADQVRGYGEITALFDLKDSLHIFFNTHGYNMAEGTYSPTDVTLWHWSKATVRICNEEADTFPANQISAAKWGAEGGAWNWTQTKLTAGVGVMDSAIGDLPVDTALYEMGIIDTSVEYYNKNYLYLQWTQFDSLNYDSTFENISDDGNNQGDIFISVSTDGGATWNRPYNVTKSSREDCAAGDCASDHWSSMAERIDRYVYMEWIYDLDAGGIPQDEGTATDNPVLFYQLPTDSVPIADEARIAWNPAEWVDPPIHIMKNGNAQVELLLENTGTKNLDVSSVSDNATWMSVSPTGPFTIDAGGCPQKVTVSVSGVNADTFLVGTITVSSNDDLGHSTVDIRVHVVESDDYKSAEFVVLENPTFQLSVSNTGNEGHQESDAGFFLKGDPNEPNYLYDGSPIVGWIEADNDTLVGRYIFNEHYMVAATDLFVDTNYNLNTIVAETESWPIRIQTPPADQDWPWWRLKTKFYFFISNDSSSGHPVVENKREQYIALKSLKLFHDAPPAWWVDVTPPTSIPETYLGMALDIDAPSDSGSVNHPGEGESNRYMYIQGFGGVNENYKMAIGQRDTCYEFVSDSFACWPAPYTLDTPDEWGMHVLRNDSTVYPQGGYADPELYTYMTTAGYTVQGDLSEADYNIVASGAKIDAHSYPDDKVWGVTYVQAVSDKYEIEDLDTLVMMCMCGNANRDDGATVSDVVAMIAYILKGTGARTWTYMGDANGDGFETIADISYMINYLFRSGRPPMCSSL